MVTCQTDGILCSYNAREIISNIICGCYFTGTTAANDAISLSPLQSDSDLMTQLCILHTTAFQAWLSMQDLLKKHNARALELRAFTKQPCKSDMADATEVMMLNPVHQMTQSKQAYQ